MDKSDSNLDGQYHDLARRFEALSQLFGQLGSPESAQALLDILTSGDEAAFNRLIDRVDIPPIGGDIPDRLGKCWWVSDIIERVVVTPTGFVEECWLRDDLTAQERALYLQIAYRHRQGPLAAGEMEVTRLAGRSVIPAGPFLDELKANSLVTCEVRMTYDTATVRGLSMPQRLCF